VRIICVLAGAILIAVAVVDTVGTLVATRIQTRRWWPTAALSVLVADVAGAWQEDRRRGPA
jgi:hypothetical protein